MDDQTLKDRAKGNLIKQSIIDANRERPPVNMREGIIYCPESHDFWREVAQRIRLAEES